MIVLPMTLRPLVTLRQRLLSSCHSASRHPTRVLVMLALDSSLPYLPSVQLAGSDCVCVSVLRVAVPARALNGPLLDSRLGRKYGILLLLSILGAASVTAM